MKTPIVMTVIAADRPGLVETLASCVANAGGNWEQSRMCRLGGQFAGIVQVEVEERQRMELLDSLHELSEQGLRIIVHEDEQEVAPSRETLMRISLVGQDHPGIIRDLSAVLFQHDANVEELHTELRSEPMSGEPLFVANVRLSLAADRNVDALRTDLEAVAADLMVDLELL
ncbi:MAG: ACT domain-containing protein [Puniceicoccaceae bacterium]